MKPTEEQIKIKEAFKNNRVLKVNAVAGSGKSTTLKMLAEDNEQSSLYICFNKVIAEEAKEKFPDHVECRTTHSLAFSSHGKSLSHKLKRPSGRYVNVAGTSAEIAKFYKINEFKCDDPSSPITPTTIASIVRQTVNRYQASADKDLSKNHIPYSLILNAEKNHAGLNKKALTDVVMKYATKLWKDRCDPSSPVLCHHDTYLKLWQLSKPILNYEIIYVDEAQDSAPTVLDVVSRQTHCKIVYVGDTYQSIYQFRGAVNAMESILAPTYTLSKSFRYGQEVADVAKWIISGEIDVKGLENIDSKVGVVDSESFTKIFRTNGHLLECAVEYVARGMDVFCEVDTRNFIKQLESAYALYKRNYNAVKHEDITPYSNWSDLVEEAEEDPDLKRLIKIVHSGETQMFIDSLKSLNTKRGAADVILTTAHKAKGKEWPNVILADDFPIPQEEDWVQSPFENMPQQEVNLFYVAATRATNTLQLPEVLSGIEY